MRPNSVLRWGVTDFHFFSSPIQLVLKGDKKPGNAKEVVERNGEAFRKIAGPWLTQLLGDKVINTNRSEYSVR